MAEKPYQDRDTLVEMYVENGMSQTEIGNEFGVTAGTISHYLRKHDISTRGGGPSVKYPKLHDGDWLRENYVEKGRSSRDIAEQFGVNKSTVLDGLRECGIERRDVSTATKMGMDTGRAGFHTNKNGYEMATSRGPNRSWGVGIHRLVAISDGADPYKIFDGDHHVHHEDNIQWDNRSENLTVATNSEHMREHGKEDNWGK